MSKKEHTDLVGFGNANLTLINGFSISKYSSIINLNIGLLFAVVGASIAEIWISFSLQQNG